MRRFAGRWPESTIVTRAGWRGSSRFACAATSAVGPESGNSRALAKKLFLRGLIRRHSPIVLIRFEQPHPAIPKIFQQRAEVHSRYLASPDDFGAIDLRVVVDILLAGIVILRIAH